MYFEINVGKIKGIEHKRIYSGEHFLDLRDDLGLATARNRELLATRLAFDDGASTAKDYLRGIAFRARYFQEP